MSKKKKQGGQPVQLSPEKYILTRARTLPIYKCLITKDWETSGMASIIVMRKHVNNHVTAGFYLVDLLALGVKDTHFQFNVTEEYINDILDKSIDIRDEADYVLVHNIIYGAVSFAEDFNKEPHKDFDITQFILEEDTDDIALMDIPFGIDGKPAFISAYHGEDEEDEDEDEDEDHEPAHDYASFSADNWRTFLNEKVDLSADDVLDVMEGLYQQWLNKYQPAEVHHLLQLRSDGFTVTYDSLNPYHSSKKEDLDLTEIFLELHEAQRQAIPSIEKKIQNLILVYPKNPVLHNYLALCAQSKGDTSMHIAISENTVQKFPSYLFGKIAWINILISENRLEEVPLFLKNTWSLNEIIPDRNVFHITEFEDYYATLIRYFIRTGDLRKAQLCFDIISDQENNENEDYPQIKSSNIFDTAVKELVEKRSEKIVEYIKELGLDITQSFMEANR